MPCAASASLSGAPVLRLETVNAIVACHCGAQTGDISIAAMRAALSAHYSEGQGLSLRSALCAS